ncbi:hypothetical protein V8M30_000253 [Serratia marcescens]
MTTIKRFTPDYKMHAVRFEAFAREAEHGELVRFDAHQQVVSAVEAERDAQQKRADALAVENAALKDAMHPEMIPGEVLDVFSDTAKYDHESCGPWSGSWIKNADEVIRAVMGSMANTETPATDAALAAIQAQGVEKAIERLMNMFASTGHIGVPVMALEGLAKELREAK